MGGLDVRKRLLLIVSIIVLHSFTERGEGRAWGLIRGGHDFGFFSALVVGAVD
ncbi:MAG: hypothetical protein M3315_05630 [Actinomycetota bacterium]|nr:hypothetical protein [Actinomycetota bacterium]